MNTDELAFYDAVAQNESAVAEQGEGLLAAVDVTNKTGPHGSTLRSLFRQGRHVQPVAVTLRATADERCTLLGEHGSDLKRSRGVSPIHG